LPVAAGAPLLVGLLAGALFEFVGLQAVNARKRSAIKVNVIFGFINPAS
jgi:hypothetical protein